MEEAVKKTIYYTALACCAVLLMGMSSFSKVIPSQTLSRQIAYKIEKTTNNSRQVALFMEQLAQKDPAQFATFLLGEKLPYIYNESIIYIGIQGTDEVLVICKIDDSDVGTFYYTAHKQGDKLTTQHLAYYPSTQGFVTLFEVK
jgi:hypothetical protein